MRSSYSGNVMGPKISVCTFPRIFIPAPWITRTRAITLSFSLVERARMEVTGAVGRVTRREQPARRSVRHGRSTHVTAPAPAYPDGCLGDRRAVSDLVTEFRPLAADF